MDSVGTGADNIAHRLNFGGAVDGNHQMIRVSCLKAANALGGQLSAKEHPAAKSKVLTC